MKQNHQAKEMFISAFKSNTPTEFNLIYSAFVKYVIKHKSTEYNSVITMEQENHVEKRNYKT